MSPSSPRLIRSDSVESTMRLADLRLHGKRPRFGKPRFAAFQLSMGSAQHLDSKLEMSFATAILRSSTKPGLALTSGFSFFCVKNELCLTTFRATGLDRVTDHSGGPSQHATKITEISKKKPLGRGELQLRQALFLTLCVDDGSLLLLLSLCSSTRRTSRSCDTAGCASLQDQISCTFRLLLCHLFLLNGLHSKIHLDEQPMGVRYGEVQGACPFTCADPLPFHQSIQQSILFFVFIL